MANEVRIVVSADDQASGKLKGIGGHVGGLSQKLRGALMPAVKVAGAAFGALGVVLGTSIKEAMESQKVIAQLEAVLKSTKGAAGLTKKEMLDMAASFQKVTTFSDEAVLSTGNVLLTFTQIKGPLMQQATQAVLDMSTALGTDLQGSAIQVGKALNDPILGMTALRRVGVSFTSEQVAVIKKLQETGQTAKAQQLIIKELNTEFGGSAAAAADTFGGRMAQLKNALSEVQTTIGMALLPVLTDLAKALSTFLLEHRDQIQKVIDQWAAFASNKLIPRVIQFLKDLRHPAEEWFGLFKLGLLDVKAVFQYIFENQALLILSLLAIGLAMHEAFGPASKAALAITAIITAIGLLDKELTASFQRIDAKRQEDLSGWDRFMLGLRTLVAGAGRAIDSLLTGQWGKAWSLFTGFVSAVWRGLMITLQTSLRGWGLWAQAYWHNLMSDLRAGIVWLGKVFNAIFGPFGITIRGIGNAVGFLINQIEALIRILKKVKFPSLPGWIGGLGGGIFGFHQAGGIIKTPFSIVGERGPELLGPASMGSRVFSNAESRHMLAGAGGGGGGQSLVFNFTFTGPVLGDQHQANELVQWLLPALRGALR